MTMPDYSTPTPPSHTWEVGEINLLNASEIKNELNAAFESIIAKDGVVRHHTADLGAKSDEEFAPIVKAIRDYALTYYENAIAGAHVSNEKLQEEHARQGRLVEMAIMRAYSDVEDIEERAGQIREYIDQHFAEIMVEVHETRNARCSGLPSTLKPGSLCAHELRESMDKAYQKLFSASAPLAAFNEEGVANGRITRNNFGLLHNFKDAMRKFVLSSAEVAIAGEHINQQELRDANEADRKFMQEKLEILCRANRFPLSEVPIHMQHITTAFAQKTLAVAPAPVKTHAREDLRRPLMQASSNAAKIDSASLFNKLRDKLVPDWLASKLNPLQQGPAYARTIEAAREYITATERLLTADERFVQMEPLKQAHKEAGKKFQAAFGDVILAPAETPNQPKAMLQTGALMDLDAIINAAIHPLIEARAKISTTMPLP